MKTFLVVTTKMERGCYWLLVTPTQIKGEETELEEKREIGVELKGFGNFGLLRSFGR